LISHIIFFYIYSIKVIVYFIALLSYSLLIVWNHVFLIVCQEKQNVEGTLFITKRRLAAENIGSEVGIVVLNRLGPDNWQSLFYPNSASIRSSPAATAENSPAFLTYRDAVTGIMDIMEHHL
jgi:hypothetical protein